MDVARLRVLRELADRGSVTAVAAQRPAVRAVLDDLRAEADALAGVRRAHAPSE